MDLISYMYLGTVHLGESQWRVLGQRTDKREDVVVWKRTLIVTPYCM